MFSITPTFDRTNSWLVERIDGPDHSVEVHETKRFRWLQFENAITQSAMWLKHPERLLLPYSQSMLAPQLFIPAPQRILMLGLGAGSWLRHFAAVEPTTHLTVIENSDAIIQAARNHFHITHERSVIQRDAYDFICNHESTYDLILVDVFDADGMPEWLNDHQFLSALRARLSSGGAVSINTMPDAKETLAAILVGLKETFGLHVLCATLRRYRNVMLFAFRDAPERTDLRAISKYAKQLERAQRVPFRAIAKNLARTNRIARSQFFPDLPGPARLDD
ncbi:MAG: fused MFS/spermidine synthase [Pseudomonadota bacterium]